MDSYGVILFTPADFLKKLDEPLFLIYQRRDSYEYIDIIRGHYSSYDNLKKLVSRLCPDEKYRILNYKFDDLWKDLWVKHDGYLFKNLYRSSKEKFDKYIDYIKKIPNTPKMAIEPSWGFPKGKREKMESEMECALREFTEETGISISESNLIDMKPFIEIYRGDDDKIYKTQYFIGYIDRIVDIDTIHTPQCIRKKMVSEEAADAKWMTLGDACQKLDARKQNILKGVSHFITHSIQK